MYGKELLLFSNEKDDDVTTAELQARLDMYLAAEQKILEGNQSWTDPAGMTYNRGNLYHLQKEIARIRQELVVVNPTSGGASYNASVFQFPGRS